MPRRNTIPWKAPKVLLLPPPAPPLTTPYPVTCEGLSARCDACQPLGGAKIRNLEQPAEGVDQHIVPLNRLDIRLGSQCQNWTLSWDPIS